MASTLIVLSHYRINVLFKHLYGANYIHTNKLLLCVGCLALGCLIVWACGWLISKIMDKATSLKFGKNKKILKRV